VGCTGPVFPRNSSALPNYTQLTVTFNSGSNSTVKVYGGFWGQGADYWMQLDDISLTPS